MTVRKLKSKTPIYIAFVKGELWDGSAFESKEDLENWIYNDICIEEVGNWDFYKVGNKVSVKAGAVEIKEVK